MTADEVLDIIDGAIDPPMTVEDAIEFLEDLQDGISPRLAGLRSDLAGR